MSAHAAGSSGRRQQATYHLHIYPQLSTTGSQTSCRVTATKDSTTTDVIRDAVSSLHLDGSKHYVLVEVKESGGEEWVLDASDSPVHRVLLWPRRAQDEHPQEDGYYFVLQERNADGSIQYVHMQLLAQPTAARRLVERGLLPRPQADFDDLCNLPELTEANLLQNLKLRFMQHKIYTYAGSILVAINPFKFLPIYNPKYVKMYENQQLGKLEPHVFALADVAYYAMLRKRVNQCIVISGESGSGKTQSTNFLIHCLTALSQKGYASGVERTILGAGPVLEAFGNAKTAHNNNSSRFGKFIQVNYLESGIVRGAVVEKYLLEKSRLVSREKDERNYHVFYYLLLGVSEEERQEFRLKQPQDYFYLNQHNLNIEDGEDLKHDFERLQQAMEMVGFLPATKKQIFSVLSAILYLGNVTYKKRATGRDEGLEVGPPEVLDTLSELLKVKRETLVEVLTKRKAVTVNDKLILPYSLSEAITARDSMAKSLYSALFDWIVLRINHALLNKKDMEEAVSCLSIGVLDIFGFEDFERNSFEQFCINYANEQLQYYFTQHIFKLEQEEYQGEGIAWHNIDYTDNVGCIHLISKKPTGLFYLLDEESNFPHATSHTLLAKFKQQHEDNKYFLGTPVLEPAFIIQHFAGRVKYQIKDFREKNMDYMRPDIVALLRGSDSSYVRQLIGMDPVAVFRWAVLRAAIRAMAVLREAGRLRAERAEKAAAGISSPGTRSHTEELPRGANTPSEKLYRDLHNQIIKSLKGLPWQGEDPRRLLQSLSRLQKPRTFFLKSKGIKQKQIIPKNLLDSKSLRLIISMTLHDRTTKSLLHLHKKKKPPSISAQFQTSLNKLLEALGKAEPFFIRCIRSNAEKKELCFDDELVLQQLRYTGMLETVRIRRSGYSAKYTFQDFTEQFQVLLPKDVQPCREAIAALLGKLQVDGRNYQIGKTKVFLKETERQALQERLHGEVLNRILLLQSWFRMVLERRHFLQMKHAALTIQACWRSYRVRRVLERTQAAVYLQATWRGYLQRRAYHRQRNNIILLQSLCRGHLQRRSFRQMMSEKQKAEEQAREAAAETSEVEPGPATTTEQLSEQPVVEQTRDLESLGVQAETWMNDRSPAGTSSPKKEAPSLEKSTQMQKTEPAENHEKVPSSREKRESRRQRGLEHVELQNKHIQSCKEESSTLREPSRRASLETGESFPEDTKGYREDVLPSGAWTEEGTAHSPLKQVQVVEAPPGSPSLSPIQRPTSLALDNRVTPVIPISTPESPKNKAKGGNSPKAQDKPESPSGSTQIQRYQHPDTERLATAVEIWRGKKLIAAGGTSAMLSQSLDLSEKHRAVGAALTPTEERRISSSTSDVSKLSPVKTLAEIDGDPSTKKPAIHKKKSGDVSAGPDTGLSPGPQGDSKSAFKRLFLHKTKDKKPSVECVEEMESNGGPVAQEASTKKNLEALSSQQHRHAVGEKSLKGKKNRNRKVGQITVSEKWRESVFRKITNANELKFLDEFLLNKVNDLRSQKTPIESLFIEATERFRSNIKTMYSVPNGKIHVGYKDLMENYQIVVNNLAAERGEKDTNLVLNVFQSLLDEFTRSYTKTDFEPTKSKAQKKKRKQERAVQEHNGHVFASYQVNIPQSCEQCLSYIWLMDKALLCSVCKMTCHKKCVHKIQSYCSYTGRRKSEPGAEPGHFGVCVDSLTSDKASVPIVLEKLLEHVEMHGLYTEGLYRKSGAANRTRELRQALQTDPAAVNLEDFPIHAITGVLKQWLRELPEPLMTFAQYGDFLRAVELPEKQEQLAAIYAVLDHLPEANHTSLERLIFHLVKVALLEDVNRMSPGALAIIFAPCLLRCPDNSDPLTSMKDVLKITTCVEMLIKEQMRKYKMKMEEINQLEAAESIAFRRLSLLRQNAAKSPRTPVMQDSSLEELEALPEEMAGGDEDREKEILMERIQSIKEEKEDITYRLPELDPRGSDEENLDSETSASTESLLEERGTRGGVEGPPAPAVPCPSVPTLNPLPAAATPPRRRPTSFVTVRVKTHRRTPIMPMANIKLPPGLPSHLTDWAPALREAAVLVRRREPPARRQDQVHSVYIAPGADLPSQGTLDHDVRLPGTKRRYSDPPTYCLPPNSSQANG